MLPVVAIIGRPNVGKSSFLNAALGRRVAIVHDKPGVTRDRIAVEMTHDDRTFELIDMGGIGIVDDHNLDEEVEVQINAALATADVIVFIGDVRDGMTSLDDQVSDLLRRQEKPVILLANKVDSDRHAMEVHAFESCGLGTPMAVSAKQVLGVAEALDRIVTELPEKLDGERPKEEGETRIAFVGQRNAGKSRLLNTLAGRNTRKGNTLQ